MSSPKATLHMLYIQCGKQPKYETTPVFASKENRNGVGVGEGEGNRDDGSNGTAHDSNEVTMMMMMVSAPFLVKPQKIGYSCTLFLPDRPPIISGVFSKKKEAEQDAAQKALQQMGKSMGEVSSPEVLSTEEKIVALAERIGALFSEKVVMSCLYLKEHFRAAIRRKDGRTGALPVAAIAALDTKIISLCKSLHPYSESDPMFTMAMVWEAAKRCLVVTCEKGFFIKRKEPFSAQFQDEFLAPEAEENICRKFEAVYIPTSEDARVKSVEIKLDPHEYYLDALSDKLGFEDGSVIMISRAITRAPHGTRLYCIVPDRFLDVMHASDPDSGGSVIQTIYNGLNHLTNRNKRASNILGFPVYGDAILANVGSSWKLEGKLSFGDVSLPCYHRLFLGRNPEGNYKLSRDAPLIAKMPCSFSSKSQWRGKLPRSLLTEFCQQHRMPDPAFSLTPVPASNVMPTSAKEKVENTGNVSYKCVVKVTYKRKDFEFESEHLYRNQNDASQSAALQALLFLSHSIKKYDNPLNPEFPGIHKGASPVLESSESKTFLNKSNTEPNKTIAPGSMVSISCTVWLVGPHEDISVESHEDFEFELGIGGTLPEIENCVLGMQVGGFEQLSLPIPCLEALLATSEDAMSTVHELDIGPLSSLRYDIKLLRTIEPPEERMESALFSPPLSKQRNEYAIRKIREFQAKSLVDLGCGSGSLLDAVLDHGTDLEHIVGVDISQKSLFRAIKSLCGKLALTERHSNSKLKELVLYEGSLAEADYRLCDFDVATCIEVVEHMDPEPLLKAGEVILGTYAPKMLILSTPNIEYNSILQRITVTDNRTNPGECRNRAPSSVGMDDINLMDGDGDLRPASVINTADDDPSMPSAIKLRNDDHRFEWTRAEFEEWANALASKFGYGVEYTGVGGSVEDPGFASQIAIFTRNSHRKAEGDVTAPPCYSVVWKYEKGGIFPLERI